MKSFLSVTTLISLVVVSLGYLSVLVVSQPLAFDFFYFVQQWPGSYCDTNQTCCYPKMGKPFSDFGIQGLWPNFNDGSFPSYCDPDYPFDITKITNLIGSMQKNWPSLACPGGNSAEFWQHEWEKHGTCSESVFTQFKYFQTALNLKTRLNIFQVLNNAEIEPNGEFYSIEDIKKAIKDATGYTPGIECNVDKSGNRQLYQVYFCLNNSGSELVECPFFPHQDLCYAQIQFPIF